MRAGSAEASFLETGFWGMEPGGSLALGVWESPLWALLWLELLQPGGGAPLSPSLLAVRITLHPGSPQIQGTDRLAPAHQVPRVEDNAPKTTAVVALWPRVTIM